MESTARVRQSRSLRRRRVIERPRLFALLDESSNRVRMLIAAAGYGKTTLAEQWVARDGRRAVWFTARSSSTDVAALALGIARAATELIPDCDERLREHLRAVPNPGERVDVLAEILGEELAGWRATDWLVLDEYDELVGAVDAEQFVARLVEECPLQLLIASRLRPTWVSSRSILYGEVLELNQTALAMDAREAAEMLDGRSSASASGIVALANGWPAVIALASVSDAEISGDHQVPDSLYRFFAEEVLEALGPEICAGLATLAVAPILDHDLAVALLGPDVADAVCGAALDVGILEERGPRLELHPLARSFLEEQSGPVPAASTATPAATCYTYYTTHRDWDAAFEIILKRGPVAEIETLLSLALDELLETARLPTIDAWTDAAAHTGIDRPLVQVARAELALRRGRHTEAQAHAEVAAIGDDASCRFRALAVAGRAAHLASREEAGLALFRRAEEAAGTDAQRREARWGQLMCEVELERPEVADTLTELRAEVPVTDPGGRVRASTQTLMCQLRMGCIDLSDAEIAQELLPAVSDPLIRSAFQSGYSSALALSAVYDDALRVATDLFETAARYRLDFAVPYASISAGMACAGLRQFSAADRHLCKAASLARAGRDRYAEQLTYAVEVRTLAAQGKHEAALRRLVPDLRTALPAIRGEVLGSRALVLASFGRIAEAETLLAEIAGITRAVELAVLCPAIRASAALKRGDDLVKPARELEEEAFRTGAVDLLVAAYRATPELLSILVRLSQQPDRLADLVLRVGDADLARVMGQPVEIPDDPVEQLSPREREVYELLCQGLQNGQIAQVLFISEATVKVHVQHIFDKLGVRSRTALAVHAALRRSDQATATRGASTSEAS
jgi:DNA-binding NarL/FixJ family response regulator